MKKNLILGLAAMALAMSSCNEDKNMYDPNFTQKEYNQNFQKRYASSVDISKQTWDYTPGAEYTLGTGAAKAAAQTRAAGPAITSGDMYNVEQTTLAWLNTNLPESTDNRAKGKPFVLKAPANTFTIVPIHQGTAGMVWDLHMVVGTGADAIDTKIWTKSQGLEGSNDGKKWESIDQGTYGTTRSKYVRAREINISDIPEGETVYFYLEVTYGVDNWAKTGTKQSSLSGMMLALDCPRPTNIDPSKQVMIIGCEDSNLGRSDWDLNDIVFMVIGDPDVPQIYDVTAVNETYDKRYMIEDLGATDDFDFNDIVVDVHGERSVTYTYTEDHSRIVRTDYGPWKQTASIVHLGGTLTFQLTIGDTTLPAMAGQMMDSDAFLADRVYNVSGWEPAQNNVSVAVMGKNSERVNNIAFPKQGDVPMIIAFPTTQKWQSERQAIPAEWIK